MLAERVQFRDLLDTGLSARRYRPPSGRYPKSDAVMERSLGRLRWPR